MGLTNYSVNPGTWKSLKLYLTNKTGFDDVMKSFLQQLSDFGTQTQTLISALQAQILAIQAVLTPAGIAALLNGAGLLQPTSLKTVNSSLGTIGTNTTVNCAGATNVAVTFNMSAAFTLNLTNLANSVPVFVRAANSTGGAFILKITGTNAAAAAFTNVFGSVSPTSAETNMQVGGASVGAGIAIYFNGTAIAGTSLFLALD